MLKIPFTEKLLHIGRTKTFSVEDPLDIKLILGHPKDKEGELILTERELKVDISQEDWDKFLVSDELATAEKEFVASQAQ